MFDVHSTDLVHVVAWRVQYRVIKLVAARCTKYSVSCSVACITQSYLRPGVQSTELVMAWCTRYRVTVA